MGKGIKVILVRSFKKALTLKKKIQKTKIKKAKRCQEKILDTSLLLRYSNEDA